MGSLPREFSLPVEFYRQEYWGGVPFPTPFPIIFAFENKTQDKRNIPQRILRRNILTPTVGSVWRKLSGENLPGGMLVTFLVYLHCYLDKSASITKFFQGLSSVSRNCSCSHLTLSRKYSMTSSKKLWLSRQKNKH